MVGLADPCEKQLLSRFSADEYGSHKLIKTGLVNTKVVNVLLTFVTDL